MVGGVSKEGSFTLLAPVQSVVLPILLILWRRADTCYVGDVPVEASITGVLRGIIKDGYYVPFGMKIAI